MVSQITNLTVVYSTVYSGADQWKQQSSASLAFVRGIHRWSVNSQHEGPVTRKGLPFDDVIMLINHTAAMRDLLHLIHVTYSPYGKINFTIQRTMISIIQTRISAAFHISLGNLGSDCFIPEVGSKFRSNIHRMVQVINIISYSQDNWIPHFEKNIESTLETQIRIRCFIAASYSWRPHQIEIFFALLALCAGNSPVIGEFSA